MKYIKISNKGLIEPEALHLVGASTKTLDQSKIGQFGSGNKYAIAYLLRNHHKLKVYAGLEEIKITTEPVTFRNEEFEIVHINNEKTSITTKMGKDWKLWQALREIYCNAIDEGDHKMEFVLDIEPNPEETHFYIENDMHTMKFIADFDKYFSMNKKVLFECEEGQIVEKTEGMVNIYRKGIRCYDSHQDSVYDYNFEDIEINESRVVTMSWQVQPKIWLIIAQCNDKEIVKKIFMNLNGSEIGGNIESTASGVRVALEKVSKEFKEALSELKLVPKGYAGMLDSRELVGCTIIPTYLYTAIEPLLKEMSKASIFRTTNGAFFKEIEMNELQKETMRKVDHFFDECNFDYKYHIKLVEFDNSSILGSAGTDTIYLSEVCLTKGVNEIANTIIEEFVHIKYGAPDETRKFQDSIISEFLDYMKKVNVYAL